VEQDDNIKAFLDEIPVAGLVILAITEIPLVLDDLRTRLLLKQHPLRRTESMER
jgi:hypothetical protein